MNTQNIVSVSDIIIKRKNQTIKQKKLAHIVNHFKTLPNHTRYGLISALNLSI